MEAQFGPQPPPNDYRIFRGPPSAFFAAAAARLQPELKETAPGVWAVGPWPYVAVYRYGKRTPFWECQQCGVRTTWPQDVGCEHIRAVVRSLGK